MANETDFVISRTFDAPRDLVWKAWTEAERLVKWWGTKGFAMGVAKLDFRPGGVFHYSMKAPDGSEMWGKFTYTDVNPQDSIDWISCFSDADGNVTRHPMAPTWPAEVQNHQTFVEENGKTTVTLRGGPINASDEEMKMFTDNHASMQAGFKGTFDQLDEYLASVK